MLIAIEGIDGSGKGTQSRMLVDRLTKTGHRVHRIDFPRYSDTFFGNEIAAYLNGQFGSLMDVPPKLGALLYAGDRYETRDRLNLVLRKGDSVVCDRYTPSNQAHHAAKLPISEWPAFFEWIARLEYDVFKIPRPDLVLLLDISTDIASQLIARKPKRGYTTMSADIHEASDVYQAAVQRAYRQLAQANGWMTIECAGGNAVRGESSIADEIWDHVHPLLENRRLSDLG